MPSAIGIILLLVSEGFLVGMLVVRRRARRTGDWQAERRLRFVLLGAFLLFFGYRVVTGDVATRLFGGVSVLVIVALIASLRDERPRV